MPYTAQTQHITATAIMSALLLIKDIAEGVVDGRFIGDVRKMKCTSKVGHTVFIAKAGTKTIIGQVTVESCTELSYDEYVKFCEADKVGKCGAWDKSDPRQRYLWRFSNPVRYEQPRSYKHPRGAQIWVNVENSSSSNTTQQLTEMKKELDYLKSQLLELQKQELMDKIEQILKRVNYDKQYRDKTKKTKFNLEWAFLLGHNISALGAKSFETPHNFKKGKGVCVTPVETRNLPKWKIELWKLSKQLLMLIDPDFASGEYVVNYSCMTKKEQYVKKHVDSDDISHQYALALGNYRNASLRCYDEHDNVLGDFDYNRKVCKMDGRLPHELVSENFEGERFCVIWFKSYDHRKTEPDPICKEPCFV